MFASQDETRTHMNCIHIEATGSALRFIATDGHTLFACEIDARDAAEDPAPLYQTPWNVSLDDADKIIRQLNGFGEISFSVSKRNVHGLEYAQQSEYFPKYENVVPQMPAYDAHGKVLPEFAAEYVARCCEAFVHYGKGLAPELPKKGKKDDLNKARAARLGYVEPSIAWRVAGVLDPSDLLLAEVSSTVCHHHAPQGIGEYGRSRRRLRRQRSCQESLPRSLKPRTLNPQLTGATSCE